MMVQHRKKIDKEGAVQTVSNLIFIQKMHAW